MLYEIIEEGCRNRVGLRFDASANIVKKGDYIDISAFGFSNKNLEDREFVYKTYQKVYYDHPEYFYLKEGIYRYGPDGPLKGIIPFYHDFAKKAEDLDRYGEKLEISVAHALKKVQGTSDPIERLLILHDHIAENTVYNWEVATGKDTSAVSYAWSAYGPLVEHDAVCKGIAMAYKLLVDRLQDPRIRCIVVPATDKENEPVFDHVWNMVLIDGQRAYHIDVNKSVNDVPTLRGKAAHTGFLMSDETLKKNGYRRWAETSPYEDLPVCGSKKYEEGYIFNDMDFPMHHKDGAFYYLKKTGSRTYSLYRGGLCGAGTFIAELPILTRDLGKNADQVSAGILWRGDHLYYVDEEHDMVRYDLTENAGQSLGSIGFQYEPSSDGCYGEEKDGIGLYLDEAENSVIAVSRTRRNVLKSFKI